MKTLLSFLFSFSLLLIMVNLKAQDSCHHALQIYSTPSQSVALSNVYNHQSGPFYGPVDSLMNYPNWFYGEVTWPGTIIMDFTCNNPGDTICFSAWGPFSNPQNPCVAQLDSLHLMQSGKSESVTVYISNALIGEFYLFCFSKIHNTQQVIIDSIFQSNINSINSGRLGNFSFDCSMTPYLVPQICKVSSDSVTNKNVIVIDSTINSVTNTISNTIIYRENASLQFDSLGTIPVNSNVFFDHTSNSMQQSYRYKIRFLDTCSNFSAYSDIHQTIHLMASNGAMGGINLDWNKYIGFQYPTHYIYKKISNGPFVLLDSVSYNSTTYTDFNGPFPQVKYRIAVKCPAQCSSGVKATDFVFSNESEAPSGTGEYNMGNIIVFPNPLTDFTDILLPVEIKNGRISIFDIAGRKVHEELFSGNEVRLYKGNLSSGVYALEIEYFGTIKIIIL